VCSSDADGERVNYSAVSTVLLVLIMLLVDFTPSGQRARLI